MASITGNNNSETLRQKAWNALQELGFISSFFSWFFMLLTRLAEPFLMLATMYIIAETAVPSWHLASVESLAIAVMVTAPEIVLPGSFVIAAKANDQGLRLAGWLQAMCWAFVVLMILTIADVLVFHFDGLPLALLMFVRCGVAVGYSILMRVMKHSQNATTLTVAIPDFVESLRLSEEKTEQRINALSELFSKTMLSMSEQVQQTVAFTDTKISENEQRIAYFLWHELQGFTDGIKQEIEQLKPVEKPVLVEYETENKTTLLPAEKEAFQSDLNEEYIDVLIAYPEIASWLATGRKTANLDEISNATKKTLRIVKNRVEKGVIKRSGRNANLYSIASVLAWLKSEEK